MTEMASPLPCVIVQLVQPNRWATSTRPAPLNYWNVWNTWNIWNELFPIHQERHDNLRQLLRLLMRDVMPRAFDGHDLRVGKKLRAVAAHGFHEVALGAVNEEDRTFEPADEGFDLAFRHRRRRAVAQNGSCFQR